VKALADPEERVYGQRACASWETCSFDPTLDSAPAHDPQLCQTNTTWGNSTGTTLVAYDQYNNVTDEWEYDFANAIGAGASCPSAPGNYLRHTNTTYTGGGYLDPSVNLVSLPETVTVDKGGTVYSKTHYGYL